MQIAARQFAAVEDYERELEREYRRAQEELQRRIESFYARYASEVGISMAEAQKILTPREHADFQAELEEFIRMARDNADGRWTSKLNEMYYRSRISRYEALMTQMQQEIEMLAAKRQEGARRVIGDVYKDTYYRTLYEIHRGTGIGASFARLDDRAIENAMKYKFAGGHFSERIWSDRDKLVTELRTNITQGFIRGDSVDRMAADIAGRMDVSLSNARRLIRTESAFFANQAAFDSYAASGIVKAYQFVATLDMRTSEVCRSMDGRVFRLSERQVGINWPPLHPNCRSTVAPVIDGEEDIAGITEQDKRAARGTDGKVYYVPASMTYKEWYMAFVEAKPQGSIQTVKEVKTQLIQRILDAHDHVYRGLPDEYRKELQDVLEQADVRGLIVYERLSKHFSRNDYLAEGEGTRYSSQLRKLYMNIRKDNQMEISLGINRKSALSVKFHEEYHQLDHLLSYTPLAKLAEGSNGMTDAKLTNTETQQGRRLLEKIKTDIINVFNRAIEWRNEIKGTKIKPVKSLDKLGNEQKDALWAWLETQFTDRKSRAAIAMFTDALGATTGGRMDVLSRGFWGHKKAYYHADWRATAEVWAEYGAYRWAYSDEARAILKSLMPETLKLLDELHDLIAEYLETHSLDYQN